VYQGLGEKPPLLFQPKILIKQVQLHPSIFSIHDAVLSSSLLAQCDGGTWKQRKRKKEEQCDWNIARAITRDRLTWKQNITTLPVC